MLLRAIARCYLSLFGYTGITYGVVQHGTPVPPSRQLAAILRVAESLDGNHVDLVLRRGKLIRVYVDARKSDAVLAVSRASKEAELWERVFDVRLEFRLRRGKRHASRTPLDA